MAGPGDISIQAISAKCREMGVEGGGVRKRFAASMQRDARPAISAIRWEALLTLPKTGGNQVRRSRLVTTGTVTIDGQDYVRRAKKSLNTFKPNQPLAERVAGASYTARVVQGKGIGQLQIRGRAKGGQTLDLKSINEGLVRHPVFGHRDRWKDQKVPGGFFTRACEANKDHVLEGLRNTAQEIAEYLMQV